MYVVNDMYMYMYMYLNIFITEHKFSMTSLQRFSFKAVRVECNVHGCHTLMTSSYLLNDSISL